ncbi:YkvA family protein [Flagellimonas zhangzhouensis]|uniref:Uncharacterized membrane protein YkvA, DUF1232 family n=1 Tax=Flagellimonas zhangzhouensis TaxID=1073328 RepID=A0A1H2YFL1_9FLAO|nr:YkvA family protein [Allomuricauda zhangzhouensis]SDQ96641.1 Uncharacterized membrane protein YkvA, DUF1232 family [Allomuricauda zhangzhouensis]SDX03339.1 Uncharacterized membrane protein YkvA, DUF1232 family [Allomuricauda zhangzhouensis]
MKKLKEWAKKLKKQLVMLHLAYKDNRTPWFAKVLIFIIIAYALSPIDLIPDFIPIIGYLDDLILLPIGIYFALKLIPEEVKREALQKAEDYKWDKKNSWIIGGIVILVWFVVGYWIVTNFLMDKE